MISTWISTVPYLQYTTAYTLVIKPNASRSNLPPIFWICWKHYRTILILLLCCRENPIHWIYLNNYGAENGIFRLQYVKTMVADIVVTKDAKEGEAILLALLFRSIPIPTLISVSPCHPKEGFQQYAQSQTKIRSSAVIALSNITRYCTHSCRNWRASYGVAFVNMWEKNDRVITAPFCRH